MKKILLADDDFTMVALLKTLLGMEGYQVETLLDKPGDIQENIRRSNPDIFLVDVYLGEKNGLDLVQAMRKSPELAHVKIVIASGIDKSIECREVGGDAFLQKPYMPDDLITILHSFDGSGNA